MRYKYCLECGAEIEEIYRSPAFCCECDKERIEKLDKQMQEVKEKFFEGGGE